MLSILLKNNIELRIVGATGQVIVLSPAYLEVAVMPFERTANNAIKSIVLLFYASSTILAFTVTIIIRVYKHSCCHATRG